MDVALEVRGIFPDLREWPADILFYGDPPNAIDFAVSHPQQTTYRRSAANAQLIATTSYAANVKDRKYKNRVEAAGYMFSAAVVETFGGWNEEGNKVIKRVANNMSRTAGIGYAVTITRLYQRISMALMRGNAKAVLASLDQIPIWTFDGGHQETCEPEKRLFEPDSCASSQTFTIQQTHIMSTILDQTEEACEAYEERLTMDPNNTILIKEFNEAKTGSHSGPFGAKSLCNSQMLIKILKPNQESKVDRESCGAGNEITPIAMRWLREPRRPVLQQTERETEGRLMKCIQTTRDIHNTSYVVDRRQYNCYSPVMYEVDLDLDPLQNIDHNKLRSALDSHCNVARQVAGQSISIFEGSFCSWDGDVEALQNLIKLIIGVMNTASENLPAFKAARDVLVDRVLTNPNVDKWEMLAHAINRPEINFIKRVSEVLIEMPVEFLPYEAENALHFVATLMEAYQAGNPIISKLIRAFNEGPAYVLVRSAGIQIAIAFKEYVSQNPSIPKSYSPRNKQQVIRMLKGITRLLQPEYVKEADTSTWVMNTDFNNGQNYTQLRCDPSISLDNTNPVDGNFGICDPAFHYPTDNTLPANDKKATKGQQYKAAQVQQDANDFGADAQRSAGKDDIPQEKASGIQSVVEKNADDVQRGFSSQKYDCLTENIHLCRQ